MEDHISFYRMKKVTLNSIGICFYNNTSLIYAISLVCLYHVMLNKKIHFTERPTERTRTIARSAMQYNAGKFTKVFINSYTSKIAAVVRNRNFI